MSYVSVHHTKEEWKANASEYSWIGFTKCRNAICVDYLLKDPTEFICEKMCWWTELLEVYLLELDIDLIKPSRFWHHTTRIRSGNTLFLLNMFIQFFP